MTLEQQMRALEGAVALYHRNPEMLSIMNRRYMELERELERDRKERKDHRI